MATLLVADDDDNARLLVRTLLSHAGHTVLEAKTGIEALACAANGHPDLILLDLSMPAMSGAEFVRALRADARTKAIAVALYTATPSNAALRDFMEIYGIADVIPKPSEPVELIAAVERALEAAGGGPSRR
ncbi:MAG TPA: response regulator [Candidatus Babeliales bacterium]|nr:response regulator [Candidatus Babeliales bacterium]